MIEVKTLGRCLVQRDGHELAQLEAQKQPCALMLFLAIEGPTARDRLLTMFWPDRAAEKARHSLSQALYSLRRDLGEERVGSRGDEVRIACPQIAIDALELEVAAGREDWERVVELYEGPFLDQFSLPGAREFEDWCSRSRTRLARTAHRAFGQLVKQRAASGDLQGALSVATRWTTLEPLEDEAQHALIALLARSGDRVTALERFESYRERLAQELDVEPLEQTLALVERIRGGSTPQYAPLAAGRTGAAAATPSMETDAKAVIAAEKVEAPTHRGLFGTILEKIRKRLVWQVAAAYLAFAWAAMQFVGVLTENDILPKPAFRGLLLVLAAGALLALSMAWTIEKSRLAWSTKEKLGRRVTRPSWVGQLHPSYVLTALLSMGLGLLLGSVFLSRALAEPEPNIVFASDYDPMHIAVLPFDVVSEGDEDLTWLSVALTDALIGKLSEVPELTVRPYTAVKRYIGSKPARETILRDLDSPGTLVEGTIVVSAARVHVSAQLVNVATWSVAQSDRVETERGTSRLVDELVREVSLMIHEAMGVQVSDARLATGTQDAEAWRLYNTARAYVEDASRLDTASEPQAALRMYAHADSLLEYAESQDPRWPAPIVERGWVASERARVVGTGLRFREPESLRSGLRHAERALALDPDHPKALELRGALRNWLKETAGPAEASILLRGAEQDLRAANTPSAWFRLVEVLRIAGRLTEARNAAYRAYEAGWLEPRLKIFWRLCQLAIDTPDWADIERWCDGGYERYPRSLTMLNSQLIILTLPDGREPNVERAWQLYEQFMAASPEYRRPERRPAILMLVAAVLTRAALPDSARAVVAQAHSIAPAPDVYVDYYEAFTRHLLGESEEALALLGRYLEESPSRKPYVAAEWWWGPLKQDPRFQALVRE